MSRGRTFVNSWVKNNGGIPPGIGLWKRKSFPREGERNEKSGLPLPFKGKKSCRKIRASLDKYFLGGDRQPPERSSGKRLGGGGSSFEGGRFFDDQ